MASLCAAVIARSVFSFEILAASPSRATTACPASSSELASSGFCFEANWITCVEDSLSMFNLPMDDQSTIPVSRLGHALDCCQGVRLGPALSRQAWQACEEASGDISMDSAGTAGRLLYAVTSAERVAPH